MPIDPVIPPEKKRQRSLDEQSVDADLDEPYSRFDQVDMSPFPDEPYAYGLGIRQVVPKLTMLYESWHTLKLFDAYFLITNWDFLPLAGDTVMSTTLDRYPLHVPEENVPRGEVFIYGVVERVLRYH